MQQYQKVALAVLSLVVVVGGIFVVIYVIQGGNGEVEDVPTNPNDVVQPLRW